MSLEKHNEARSETSSTVENLKKICKYTNVEREKVSQNNYLLYINF